MTTIYCKHCGCNTQQLCCCAKDCQQHPIMATVTVGPRMRLHLSGGSLFQEPHRVEHHGYGSAGQALVAAVNASKPTERVALTEPAAVVLAEMAADLLEVAIGDPDAHGDVSSARRLLAQLARQGVRP